MTADGVAFAILVVVVVGGATGFMVASQVAHGHPWWRGFSGPVYCGEEPGQPCFPGQGSDWQNETEG